MTRFLPAAPVARYERNRAAAPAGYPAGGLAALLHVGALAGAGELAGGPRTLALTFRQTWPPWVLLDERGHPMFDRLGMLRLDPQARLVPPVNSDTYRMVVRDAYLLAGRLPRVDVDGRKEMALRHHGEIPPALRRPASSNDQREVAELAHRTGQPLGVLLRLAPGYRQAWLAQLRAHEAQQVRREIIAFTAQIASIANR